MLVGVEYYRLAGVFFPFYYKLVTFLLVNLILYVVLYITV